MNSAVLPDVVDSNLLQQWFKVRIGHRDAALGQDAGHASDGYVSGGGDLLRYPVHVLTAGRQAQGMCRQKRRLSAAAESSEPAMSGQRPERITPFRFSRTVLRI